jgi:large subunit ribosomal protein L4
VLKAELMKQYEAACIEYDKSLEVYQSELLSHEEQIDDVYTNIALSCRNIPNADVINAKDFNVYQVLNADYIVLAESAIEKINEVLNK